MIEDIMLDTSKCKNKKSSTKILEEMRYGKPTKEIFKKMKKTKKQRVSATQKSLKLLRDEGYLCEVVEKTIPKCFIKKDLFGFIDLLAIKEGKILGVQATTCGKSGGNDMKRIRKIKNHENYPKVKESGIKIVVHGWRQLQERYKNGNPKKVWKCKIINL